MHVLSWQIVVNVWAILRRLGGPGLVLLGIIDNSFIPVPGSTDLFTIVLSTVHRELWLYYALMSTLGAVIGGYITYGIGHKGGKEALEGRVPQKRLKQVDKAFEKWGFGTVLVSSILPPPFPMVAVLVGAGALQYPVKKFLLALTLGRGARFVLVAFIASLYGQAGFRFITGHSHALTIAFICIGILGASAITGYLLLRRKRRAA